MSPEEHDRVSKIFLRALELSGAERDRYLRRACGEDGAIVENVESLLLHQGALPRFLRTGFPEDSLVRGSFPVPERIGPYEILEVLGEGGMGIVYRGEQSELMRRQAAIKVIHAGALGRAGIARFEAERQALAVMNHPNIARVFDGGSTDDGLPYFAMEYLEGEPITQYCDRLRLDVGERLDLFRQVCLGVQHAHHNAIIHRDIKPSNVLVVTTKEGAAVPKIIDFGVAKGLEAPLTEKTLETVAGQFLGTPAYMSPEQADAGEQAVDTRTDVYSLGALLYELLVSRPPFHPDDLGKSRLDEALRRIRQEDPMIPSRQLQRLGDRVAKVASRRRTDATRLARQLSGDLDWITMKALEKSRDRRYGSPSEMLDDIDRFRRNEPVLASQPSRFYRMKKFVRKHRTASIAAGVIVPMLFGFIFTMTIQAGRIVVERERADRQTTETEEVSEFLIDLFDVTSPTRVRGVRWSPGAVFERGIKQIERLGNRPELQARLQATMGRLYLPMGRAEESAELLEQAVDRLRLLRGPDAPATLEAMHGLAVTYWHLGEKFPDDGLIDEAERLLETIAEHRVATLGLRHPESLMTYRDLGFVYKIHGRHGEAEAVFETALRGMEDLQGKDHPETLVVAALLGGIYIDQQRYDEAQRYLLDLRPRIAETLGDQHTETHGVVFNIAITYAAQGDEQTALATLGQAVDSGFSHGRSIWHSPEFFRLQDEPEFVEIASRARVCDEVTRERTKSRAMALIEVGGHEQAEALLGRVLECEKRRWGDDHDAVLETTHALARIAITLGRWEEGESMLRQLAHKIRPRAGGGQDWTIDVLWYLAQCHARRGETDAAVELIERAKPLYVRSIGLGLGVDRFCDGCISALRGDHRQALQHLRQAVVAGFSQASWLSRERFLRTLHGELEFQTLAAELNRLHGSCDRSASPSDSPHPGLPVGAADGMSGC